MKTIIIAGGAIFFIAFGAYFAGGRVAAEKCRAETAEAAGANSTTVQHKIIETKGRINDETFITGIFDIRNWLHQRYTIRD
jgi:hypothetical protein